EEARLLVLESNIHTLEKQASSEKAQIDVRKAKVWKQELENTRYENLYQNESATKQQLEDVQATLEVYRNDYLASINSYEAAAAKIDDVKAEIAVVKSEISRLK